MWAPFRHELRGIRGQVLGWGLALGVLGAYFMSVFNSFDAQMAQLKQVMEYFPAGLFAFFDLDVASLTPFKFLDLKFFSLMPIILGIFAILVCSGLIAGDEEKGLLDLILSHPVSRRDLFFGKVLAFLAGAVAIVAIMWISIVLFMDREALQVSTVQMVRPMISLLGMVLLFGALALVFSMVLPSRRLASSAAGFLAVASFFITGMAGISSDLKTLADFSPFTYYQGGKAAFGLNVGWVIGLLVSATIFVLLAWWRFERRDIRVGGEGGWRLALPTRIWRVRRRPSEARHAA